MRYQKYEATIGEIRDKDVDVVIDGIDSASAPWSGMDTQGDAIKRALWILLPNPYITIGLCVLVIVVVAALVYA